MAVVRGDLTAHVGGNPSPTQRRLIEQIAWLQLRVAMLNKKIAAGEPLTECDSNTYLAWSNSLTRSLRALGLDAKPQRTRRSLADYAASRAASPEVAL